MSNTLIVLGIGLTSIAAGEIFGGTSGPGDSLSLGVGAMLLTCGVLAHRATPDALLRQHRLGGQFDQNKPIVSLQVNELAPVRHDVSSLRDATDEIRSILGRAGSCQPGRPRRA
jgi:hypothetical protein